MDDRHYSTIAGALSTGDPHVVAILMPMLKSKGGQVINALGCILLFGLVASFLLPLLGTPSTWTTRPSPCSPCSA